VAPPKVYFQKGFGDSSWISACWLWISPADAAVRNHRELNFKIEAPCVNTKITIPFPSATASYDGGSLQLSCRANSSDALREAGLQRAAQAPPQPPGSRLLSPMTARPRHASSNRILLTNPHLTTGRASSACDTLATTSNGRPCPNEKKFNLGDRCLLGRGSDRSAVWACWCADGPVWLDPQDLTPQGHRSLDAGSAARPCWFLVRSAA